VSFLVAEMFVPSCVQPAEPSGVLFLCQRVEVASMGWRTSKPNDSKDSRIGRHVDVEKYDDRGRKDKSAGKMKVDHDERRREVRDIQRRK
jgi:hypothetical protein